MKTCLLLLSILIFSSCTKNDDEKKGYLNSFRNDKYFNQEVFMDSYRDLYGLWEAYSVFGGWSGYSEPDFDYLEMKPFGIYGLIRNDTLFEYGKISQDIFDLNHYFPGNQVKLVADYKEGAYSRLASYKYFDIVRKDTLTIYDGLIDGTSIIFKRVK